MKRQLAVLTGCLVVATGLLPAMQAHAAAPPRGITYSGLTVSPAIEEVHLSAGQTTVAFATDVSNKTATPMTVEVSLLDFTALNTNGGVSFLQSTGGNANPHGLAQWLAPSQPRFTLAAGATQKEILNIPNTTRLAPGGHYGAVIYRAVPAAGGASNGFTANEEVSQLLFLTTYQGGIAAVSLHKPDVPGFTTHLPDNINLVFTNTGNEQTAPRGIVSLSDGRGRMVARSIINTASGLILPGTDRLYQVALQPPKNMFMPGVYHLKIDSQAADNAPASTYTQSIVYVSTAFLLVSLGALIMLAVALHWALRHRKFRRHQYRG